MDLTRGILLTLVGVVAGVMMAWFIPAAPGTDGGTAVAERLSNLERRLAHLERLMSGMAASVPTDATREMGDLREEVRRLTDEVSALTRVSAAPQDSAATVIRPESPQDAGLLGLSVATELRQAGVKERQFEDLVTDLVASLAHRYLEEQVSQLYAAQKQADDAAQQEAQQRRREEAQERRLTQLVNDLQTFVPGLTAVQVEDVAQAIQEQWEVMGAMRQQASERGTFLAPGDILRQAREITDAKLYAVLSGPQLEAFRHWREARFGAPGETSR